MGVVVPQLQGVMGNSTVWRLVEPMVPAERTTHSGARLPHVPLSP